MTTRPKILIVDDDSVLAMDTAHSLKNMGYEVVGSAVSREEAIEFAEATQPDLVLMDLLLKGGIDGMEAAKRIADRSGCAIVYLTANADKHLLERAKIMGPYAHVQKPVSYSDLRFSVEMALFKNSMERKLRTSEERFRLLYEEVPLSYFTSDKAGRISVANKACLELFGYRSEDVLGRDLNDFLSPEYRDRLMFHTEELRHADVVLCRQLEMMRNDKSRIIVELHGKTARNSDGEFAGMHCILYDITERKRSEESVRKSEEKFSTIFGNSQDLLLIIDSESGAILSANPAVERLLGYEAQDVMGESFSAIFPGASGLLHDVDGCNSGEGGPVLSSHPLKRADGSELFVDMIGTIIPWEERTAVLVSFRDVSERMCVEQALKSSHDRLEVRYRERAEELAKANEELQVRNAECRRTAEALRESEERFRTIVHSATDCIFIKDESRRYTVVNPAMEEILGLPSRSILGKTDEDIFGKEAAAHLREVDSRVLGGEHIEEEHTRPVMGSASTFLDTRVPMVVREKIVGICGISRNITNRKQQETDPLPMAREYNSEAMRSTMAAARLAAERSSTILITGESGTGKGHLARYIHDRSPRLNGRFFAINCAAVPANLAESELFGHEAGAFTGADRRKRGLLELAEGGTLLLDEIGELSPDVQAKLLTFLDTRTFTRVGGEKSVTVDARLIVATNRNLLDEVSAGRFRADLFYRLDVFSLWVPPLRERSEDLPALIEQVLQQIATEIQLPGLPRIDPDTMEKMQRYRWPGNVRELRNVLERAAILSSGSRLDSDSFDLDESSDDEEQLTFQVARGQPLDETVRDLKMFLVNQALRTTGGNKTAAARILGVSRHSVINYLKQESSRAPY